jgi:hypothetical protein
MRPRGRNRLRSQDFHGLVISKMRQRDGAPTACARFPLVKRFAAALVPVLVAMLVMAPAALAENGVGIAGPTDDKMVTFFCFGVIAFFALIPIVMSLIQGRLEKRKEQRRTDIERFG